MHNLNKIPFYSSIENNGVIANKLFKKKKIKRGT